MTSAFARPTATRIATRAGLALLGGTLLVAGIAKLTSPHRATYLLPSSVHYLVAALEVASAVALTTRWRPIVLRLLVAFFAVAALVSILHPSRACGCVADWIDARYKGLLAGTLGLLAMALASNAGSGSKS